MTRGTSSFASWAFVSGYGIISDRFIDVTNTGTTAGVILASAGAVFSSIGVQR